MAKPLVFVDAFGTLSAHFSNPPALGARITILDREPHISYQGDGIMISYLILGIDHQLYNQYHS